MSPERRLAFGQVAELYDRARPSYPERLIDDVLEFAGVRAGDLAVEVGAGTGKATALFAARGLRIVALEPSRDMAGIARRNTAGLPNVVIEETEFEHWSPERPCRLLYSAQAWHWINPQVRFVQAGRALVKDGALAAFWNRVRWESSPLRAELEAVYRREAPELGSALPPGPMFPSIADPGEPLRDWQGDARLSTGFSEPDWREYTWIQTYGRDDYLSLLQTHSDHLVLAPLRRRDLLTAVGETIDRAGGVIEIEYVTRLGLARPAGGQPPLPG
jgi:SAM-dependent methyltransferase